MSPHAEQLRSWLTNRLGVEAGIFVLDFATPNLGSEDTYIFEYAPFKGLGIFTRPFQNLETMCVALADHFSLLK